MTEAALQDYLDEAIGDHLPITVAAMTGGGSCDVFALVRGSSRWVLRRAPRHASSASAHNVLREFRILDAIKDEPVPIARPVLACADPEVFEGPFYVMERIDGLPIRSAVPEAWASMPETHGLALQQLIDALVAIHAVDWRSCGLSEMARPGNFLSRQLRRWLAQLDAYGGRDLPVAHDTAKWLEVHQPADQALSLFHGDYKLDNVLFAAQGPPRLLAVVDWEMAGIGDPLVDVAWAMIFYPGPDGTMPLGVGGAPAFAVDRLPSRQDLLDRYARQSGRDLCDIGWYDVFARWKLAIALEGSYVKHLHGRSDKPIHQSFGHQADLLLDSATTIIERGATPMTGDKS
jgi:aminoglycoside phosphotransferase (APT) family kinase protein